MAPCLARLLQASAGNLSLGLSVMCADDSPASKFQSWSHVQSCCVLGQNMTARDMASVVPQKASLEHKEPPTYMACRLPKITLIRYPFGCTTRTLESDTDAFLIIDPLTIVGPNATRCHFTQTRGSHHGCTVKLSGRLDINLGT